MREIVEMWVREVWEGQKNRIENSSNISYNNNVQTKRKEGEKY